MEIYNYHAETKEYTGQGFADPSPLEPGKWLIPANATTVMPPSPLPGKVRCFDGTAWIYTDIQEESKDPDYLPSLNSLASAKLERINEAKNVALDAGFLLVLGEGEEARAVLFDSDAKARLAYLELAVKLGQTPAYSTPWKASRGQWVTMDAALFAALQPAYEAHIQTCFAWQAAREQDVAAALALVTPILGPSTPVLDENGNQVFNEDGTEAWAPGEPTGEMDETAARAALETISEAV